MHNTKMVLLLLALLITFSLGEGVFSQELELGEDNVITISANDKAKGILRYKEFYIEVKQGDTLSFDIKGKSGVNVATSIELLPNEGSSNAYRSRTNEFHQQWTSEPLPACRMKVRILANRPYGALSVFVEKHNPSDKRGEGQSDIEKMTVEQLIDRHRQLLAELQKIVSELARRH